MSKIYPPIVAELIDQFRNEVLCRNEGNQEKAARLWKSINPHITPDESREISTEWNHYLLNQIDTNTFGEMLKRLATKYRTI